METLVSSQSRSISVSVYSTDACVCLCQLYSMCVPAHIYVCWPNSEACTIKLPVDSLPDCIGQPMDSVHQLRQDKRVFILAIAAVLSALPLHILVVFSDKAGQSAAGPRGLQCSGRASKLGQRKRLVVI